MRWAIGVGNGVEERCEGRINLDLLANCVVVREKGRRSSAVSRYS